MDVKYNILTVWVPVFYANDGISFLNLRFENDVKMYGTQTNKRRVERKGMFENDVKMYGTQTASNRGNINILFENDVKMYGTQTEGNEETIQECLRMM